MPPEFWTDPLIYQGGSDDLLGACDDVRFADEAHGIDLEAGCTQYDAREAPHRLFVVGHQHSAARLDRTFHGELEDILLSARHTRPFSTTRGKPGSHQAAPAQRSRRSRVGSPANFALPSKLTRASLPVDLEARSRSAGGACLDQERFTGIGLSAQDEPQRLSRLGLGPHDLGNVQACRRASARERRRQSRVARARLIRPTAQLTPSRLGATQLDANG
jgi:hypothetical protein